MKIAIRRRSRPVADAAPPDDWNAATIDAADLAIVERATPHTMTTRERLVALIDAVRYVVGKDIPGGFAECGVWRGGSVLAVIATLQELGVDDRDIYLFDTFEGMTEPTEHDTSAVGDAPAIETWNEAQQTGERAWNGLFDANTFNEQSVRETLLATGYPEQRLHFVRGPVEETLPDHTPESIALLRLDTDWYESTKAEMEHMYPRLAQGGVLIIDDYGHWEGARRAVDEYLAAHDITLLLSRIDYTGRIALKT